MAACEVGRSSFDGCRGWFVFQAMKAIHDIPYLAGGSPRQRLDLYLPDHAHAPMPAVLWIHGGAWECGDKNPCPVRDFAERGYVIASIGYRLSDKAAFPSQLQDCKSAVRWLRAYAAEYGIDPTRIGVWGESAGGHLAALLGTTGFTRDFDEGDHLDQSSEVQCVVNWFGPVDFLEWGAPFLLRWIPRNRRFTGCSVDRFYKIGKRPALPVRFIMCMAGALRFSPFTAAGTTSFP